MTPTESLPRALVSAGALREGARQAIALGGTLADLRGDALGHGVVEVAAIVQDAGINDVLVDDAETAASLRTSGLRAVTDGNADIDNSILYGLPGAPTPSAMRLFGRVLSTKPLHAGRPSPMATFTGPLSTRLSPWCPAAMLRASSARSATLRASRSMAYCVRLWGEWRWMCAWSTFKAPRQMCVKARTRSSSAVTESPAMRSRIGPTPRG